MKYPSNEYAMINEWNDIEVDILTDIIEKEYGAEKVEHILSLDVRTKEGTDALVVVAQNLQDMNHPSMNKW